MHPRYALPLTPIGMEVGKALRPPASALRVARGGRPGWLSMKYSLVVLQL
eukprot:COSAG05_NODE_1906_length_3849_cov_63.156800_6_plen_50_part_00